MAKLLVEEEVFEAKDFRSKPLPIGEYEECTFQNCNFSSSNLSRCTFASCEFIDCDWSMAKLGDTALRNVSFANCKLLGLRFEHCNDFLFEITCTQCQLDFSSFYQRMLKKTIFTGCSLKEVDFSEANLQEASFDNCNLQGAIFDQTQLQKADLRSASDFSIDPERNNIKKACFSLEGLVGLLTKYDLKIA